MKTLLPLYATGDEFDHSPHIEEEYRPAIVEICQRHHIPSHMTRKYDGGTTVVFAVGNDYVVKLYPPFWPEQFHIEDIALRRIFGKIGIPTPEVHFMGELEGWGYIIMSQLKGKPLSKVWDSISRNEQVHIIEEIGETVARLHALPTEGFTPYVEDWNELIERQALSCFDRQKREGLSEYWLNQVPDYLERHLSNIPTFVPALLHTELTYEVWLVDFQRDHWRLSGVLDFADVLIGHNDAEWFNAKGDRELFRKYLLSYGYSEDQLTPELQNRKMLYLLLHRYVGLNWAMKRMPSTSSAKTIEDIASVWFAF
jgi:hygromycin-B 7''-O-kinase